MGTTPNLGLPVYGLSDTPDWMDTNNGFEKLDNIVGGAAGVQLDFANPIFSFSTSVRTYTATKRCWLLGGISCNGTLNKDPYISINGTRITAKGLAFTISGEGNQSAKADLPYPLMLQEGDVVDINADADSIDLHVFEGEIVSDTFVWNEAIVELDYGNPLHSFTSGHYTYTVAGDDEWLCGNLNNGDSKVSINGTIIGVGLGDVGRCSYPYMAPLKVSRGDVIAVTSNFDYLHVFRGTIKGSAPGNSGGGDVLELLDFDNAIAITTTNITASKAGAIIINGYNISTNVAIYINDVDYGYIYGSANTGNVFLSGIPKGTRIKLSQATANAKAYFVPYKYESIAPEITVYNEAEVELDYANPLHTFTTGNLTYTATEECYLFGQLWSASGQNELTINGVTYYRGYYSSPTIADAAIVYPIKLKAGDIVAVQNYANLLHVLKGTKVGSVGQLNPAPKPDYNTAIAELTGASGSYTCTKDCFAQIGLLGSNGSAPSFLKVNDHKVAVAFTTNTTNLNLDLKQGDVISWSDMGTASTFINIFDYLS